MRDAHHNIGRPDIFGAAYGGTALFIANEQASSY